MKEKKTKIKRDLFREIRSIKSDSKNTGITLIALVITIIVLLILAGVVINMALGNDGIITRAERAVETQEKAALMERIDSIRLKVKMDAITQNEEPTLEEFLQELDEAGMVADSEETGEDEYTVITPEGYIVTIGLDENKKHLMVNIVKKDTKILARQVEIKTITGEAIGALSGKVTITTNGAIGATYTYEAISGGTTIATITTTRKTAIFEGLSAQTTYDIKVTATGKGTDTKTQTSAFTTSSIPAGLGNITGTMVWNSTTHKAKIRINTGITGFTMKYSTDGTNYTTIANNGLTTEEYNVGDTIYVIFAAGNTNGDTNYPAEITVVDGDNPVITSVSLTTTGDQDAGSTITGAYVATDNESGIDLSISSRWLLDTSPTAKSTTTAFTAEGAIAGGITNSSTITMENIDKPGTYYLHIMIVDKGNPANVVYAVSSNTVKIKVPPLSSSVVANNYDKYIGSYVEYSAGGISDWQIFDIIDGKIVLISSVNAITGNLTVTNNVLRDSVRSITGNPNAYIGRGQNSMSDSSDWTTFVNDEVAQYALRGPDDR